MAVVVQLCISVYSSCYERVSGQRQKPEKQVAGISCLCPPQSKCRMVGFLKCHVILLPPSTIWVPLVHVCWLLKSYFWFSLLKLKLKIQWKIVLRCGDHTICIFVFISSLVISTLGLLKHRKAPKYLQLEFNRIPLRLWSINWTRNAGR